MVITEEHKRRSNEWKPYRPAAFYAVKEFYSKSLGYREELAHMKALTHLDIDLNGVI